MLAKLTKVTAIAAVSLFALTACTSTPAGGGSAPAAGGQLPATTIKILAPNYGDTSKADWDKIIAEFNKKEPNVKVELQMEAWETFGDKVKARIQANDLPDILNDNAFASEAAAGLLYPISEVMSDSTLKSIEPSLLKNGVGSDGKQWAAPDIASARMMVANTGLLKAAGVAEAPKTWADLEADCAKIVATKVACYGMPLGKEEAQVESSLWLWGAGGDWVKDGTLVADQPAAVEGFTEIKKLIDAKATQADPGASNRQAVADAFNQGKVAMYVTHSGLMATTRKDFSSIKYSLSQIPSKDGSPVAFGVTDFILAFNNKDDNRKQATKEFLDLFYSDAMYEGWYKGTGLLPVTTSMITAAKASDADNKDFYDSLSYVKFNPVSDPKWDALKTALQGTAGTIQKDTPENVLKAVQSQLDAAS